MRSIRTAWTILALGAAVAVTGALRAADIERHNVLLLIADDLGQGDLGCYGHPALRTPHIDELAGQGTRFTHAFATASSCSDCRAAIYSGLFSHTNGQFALAHMPAAVCSHDFVRSLPRLVHDAGYRTGLVGQLHVRPDRLYPWDVWHDNAGGIHHRNVLDIARLCRQFLRDTGDRPFLLTVGFGDPHRTREGLFGNELVPADVPRVRYKPSETILRYFMPDEPEVRQELAEYYGAVSRLDLGVGLVLQALKETGNADRTLVLFLSDNGIPFPVSKTNLYDPGINLPLIVSSPNQKRRGAATDALVSWVDVLPTILDWTGAKPAYPLPGRSFLPVLNPEHADAWDVVYGSQQLHEITMYYPMRMIRTRRHKYILNLASKLDFPMAQDLYGSLTWQGVLRRGSKFLGQRSIESYVRRPREELYDLKSDPHELKNVAGEPAYAPILSDLRARLRSWQEKTSDPWIIKYIHE